jgi:hypothetical protein
MISFYGDCCRKASSIRIVSLWEAQAAESDQNSQSARRPRDCEKGQIGRHQTSGIARLVEDDFERGLCRYMGVNLYSSFGLVSKVSHPRRLIMMSWSFRSQHPGMRISVVWYHSLSFMYFMYFNEWFWFHSCKYQIVFCWSHSLRSIMSESRHLCYFLFFSVASSAGSAGPTAASDSAESFPCGRGPQPLQVHSVQQRIPQTAAIARPHQALPQPW